MPCILNGMLENSDDSYLEFSEFISLMDLNILAHGFD